MLNFYDIEKIKNNIIHGETLKELRKIPDNCIDMIITSPPYYGLRSYLPNNHPDKLKEIGLEDTFEEYLEKILKITAEIKRVLKPTGTFFLNLGDCYGGSNNGSNDYREEKGKSSVPLSSRGPGAKKLKRNFIGIELSKPYCEIAKKRIRNQQPPLL